MESKERTERRPVFAPRMDIVEKKESYLVTAEVPGADPQGVEIKLDGDVLSIKAKVKPPEVGGLPLLWAEYEEGDYETSLRLSEAVDREKIEAELKEGILTLTLPKAAELKPRQIKVRAA